VTGDPRPIDDPEQGGMTSSATRAAPMSSGTKAAPMNSGQVQAEGTA